MDVILAAALNEISACGKQGCTLQNLWTAIQGTSASAGFNLCEDDGVKNVVWKSLLNVPGLGFASGDCNSNYNFFLPDSRSCIQNFKDAEALRISIIAPEHLRESCVGVYDLKFSDAGLSGDQWFALERLAKAKSQGVTQNQLAKEFGIKGNKLFYIVRSLESRGLLVRQSTLVRSKDGNTETEKGLKSDSIVNTNLIHLSRYAKNLSLSSQQRFEIRKSNSSDNMDDGNCSHFPECAGEGDKENVLIKDDLPAMKAICDKLEEADGKVLVVSDLKVSLDYRFTAGHRAWRRLSKRLKDAGVIEVFQAKVDNKVAPCIRLLKSFDPRDFNSKAAIVSADVRDMEPIKGTKRGQVTDQVVEIPIDYQIYDMIDNAGFRGLTVSEMCKRLGLNNKRNYYRLTNMIQKFGLQLRAESHKKSVMYRVWTKNNPNFLNESVNFDQQDSQHEGNTPELGFTGGTEIIDDTCNAEQGHASVKMQGKEFLSKIPESNVKFLKAIEQEEEECNPTVDSQALTETMNQKETIIYHSEFDGKGQVVAPLNSVSPFQKSGPRYPCLSVTTSSLQREQRILEKLEAEKFVLRVELYRWLEDLERGKDTTMDRKTLSRALKKLQDEGHCKIITVSVPVITNCRQNRTTEVVLHPSLELGPDIIGQIHEKLRNFDMQSRGQGLSRPKDNDSVPILTGIKRKNMSEPSDSQTIRAESMRANGYIPAKMVRVKMLHQFLWGYVMCLPNCDKELCLEKKGVGTSGPNSTCKIFNLDAAIRTMPLELFLQVIGSVTKIKDLTGYCRQRMHLDDLGEDELRSLMDKHATGRLSWLVDVLRRLKLLRLVMREEMGAVPLFPCTATHAILTYAIEFNPYIEEPARSVALPLAVRRFDFRPKHRRDFVLVTQEAVDAYWKALEHCFSAVEPAIGARAFPGSSVPEIFLQRSWTSLRVMSVEQREELLKRIEYDNLEKRLTARDCDKIAKDLNLSLEQVLKVSYEKNKRARQMASKREALDHSDLTRGRETDNDVQHNNTSKKRRISKAETTEDNITVKDLNEQSFCVTGSENGYEMSSEQPQYSPQMDNKVHCKADIQDTENEDFEEDEAENAFINHISKLKPSRKKRFNWTECLERSLITKYARYRAMLGPRCHRVEWGAISDLPAPPDTCRRRISNFMCVPSARKALMKLCELLKSRYITYLQQTGNRQFVDRNNVKMLPILKSSTGLMDDYEEGINNQKRSTPQWDDFSDPEISDAVDNVLKFKSSAKLPMVKRSGGSALMKGCESAGGEGLASTDIALVSSKNNNSVSSKVSSPSCSGTLDVTNNTPVRIPSSVDRQSSSQANMGEKGPKTNKHRIPMKVQKLLAIEDLSPEDLVRNSVAVANAVELIKLVFLNSSRSVEVPSVLVNTLRRYNESDVYAAFNFLMKQGLVVAGHGVQPFILSSKFFHSASASPFPVGTGERASKFSKWLTDNKKALEEDGVNLPTEQQCGDLFQMFGLVYSGEILISPLLPSEGIGEPEDRRGLKRKMDKEKDAGKIKLRWPGDGEVSTRRERGFPGIEVQVHCATLPISQLVSGNSIDKDTLGRHHNQLITYHSSRLDIENVDSYTKSCDFLAQAHSSAMVLPLDSLTKFAEGYLLSSICLEGETSLIDSGWFVIASDVIEKSGENGLSLEQLADAIGINGHRIERADAVAEALQAFSYVKKVNAFEHIRVIPSSRSMKYFIHLSDTDQAGTLSHAPAHQVCAIQEERTCDTETICNLEERYYTRSVIPVASTEETVDIDYRNSCPIIDLERRDSNVVPELITQPHQKEADSSWMVRNYNTESGDVESDSRQNVENNGLELNQDEQSLVSDRYLQVLPILPWLTADGQMNTSLYRALRRRVLGIVMQNPGILEEDLVKRLDVLNPETARKLLELLQLEHHVSVRTVSQSKGSPPSLLKQLIGANCKEQKMTWKRHYYASPSCIQLL
eukprot:TRINITY_DN17273_c0_g1_i1.p1 TRINITY_DN17273_c0_g1~~TRINITY_DN17273_c0_g1_i1.p1  ORF type:complete len:1948 (+),score=400.33 TRINITY_DN17273_c0_g1_i1:193-6036(+)